MKKYLIYLLLFGLGVVASVVYFKSKAPVLSVPTNNVKQQKTASSVYSYADAVKRAKPAVVNINTSTVVVERNGLLDDPVFKYFFGDKARPREKLQTSLGSGVLVSRKGYVLTNNHVIKNADKIKVSLNDGRSVTAKLIGADVDTDLAVLKINLDNLPEIVFGNSKALEVGDVSLAIGNPFGVGQTVTMGIVSAIGRSQLGISNLENFIQTDAAINPGNSGGALINARGELIGINTAIFSRSGASHGIGFAIPSAMAKQVLEGIVKHGKVIRGWIGVETQDLTSQLAKSFSLSNEDGVVVTGLYRGSPAEKSGLQPGDVMLRLDDKEIKNAGQWKMHTLQLKPEQVIQIGIIRRGKAYTLSLKVGQRPLNIR